MIKSHKIGNSEVFLQDCVEGMKRFPDNYFDISVCDPPYGIDRNGMNMGNSVFNKDNKKWDNSIPDDKYFKELFRVSKNQIIWGGNYFPLPSSQYFAVWDKGGTMYGRDFAECELAWVRLGGTRIYKKSPNQSNRIHPTQKHVSLYDFIYKNYAKGGMKVLDTHLGSQSNRISAEKNKMIFTAFETDEDYFNQGNKRYEDFKKQLTIF